MKQILPALALSLTVCGIGCTGGILGDPDGGPSPDGGPGCGNGVVEGTEQCDLGAGNGPNNGCERDCRFSCVAGDPLHGDAQCDPHDLCKGTGSCGGDHICRTVNALPGGASCATGKICRSGACQDPVCGDGYVTAPEQCDDGVNDGSHGCGSDCRFTTARCGDNIVQPPEQCDPPDGTTCDSNCKLIVHAAVCGNGVREGTEECDDGNTTNLDGCDSTCHFEQDQRANAVTMKYVTDSFCTANAIGSAIGSLAQSNVQKELDATVADGALTMAFHFLSLGDLGGTNAASFKLGAVSGKPVAAPPLRTYDGTKDLDWWYTAEPTDLDGNRLPVAQLDASIQSKVLNAGPGQMKIGLVFGGAPVQLASSGVKVRADVGGTSAPVETQGATPGHLPAEHVDPVLVSFASLANGKLCGNIAGESLASVPAPLAVQTGGAVACDEGYVASNTMLDVLVRGCTLYGFITAVAPTQPDQVDPAAPAAGAGGPYQLSVGNGTVSGCKDKRGASVDLAACLHAAAYSSYFTFTADRVVLK